MWVLFKTRQDHAQAMTALRRAIEAVDQSLSSQAPGEPPEIGPGWPEASPRGPVVYLDFCDSADILKRWATAVAAELEAQGASGSLTEVRPEHTPYDPPGKHVDCTTAGLVLPIHENVTHRQDDGSGPLNRWPVDDDLTTQMVDEVLDFCLRGSGEVFFKHGMTQFRIDPAEARTLVAQAITHGPPVSLTSLGTNAVIRRATLYSHGRAFFEWRDESLEGSQLAEGLSRILVAHADRLEYGFVRQSWLPAVGWDNVVDWRPPLLPRVPVTYSRRPPHLERTLVPDAYGIQLLSRAHLDRAPDLREWQVEEVAPGRYIDTSKQLDAWFGPEDPSEDTFEKARREFGSLIMDEEDYDRRLAEELAEENRRRAAETDRAWFILRPVRRTRDGLALRYEYCRRDGSWISDRADAESFGDWEHPPSDLIVELRKEIDPDITGVWLTLDSGDVGPKPPPEPREDV
jgi:hypothetical protein